MKMLYTLAVAAGLASGAADAATVLRQDYIENGGGQGSSPGFQSYDDFRLSSTTSVVALSWWAQDFSVATRTFQIRFTDTDSNWDPNAANPFYSATVVATGVNVGLFTYRFDVNLPVPVVLAGNRNLFVSVSADNFIWGRASNHPSPGVLGGLSDSYNVGTGSHILQYGDLAWALYDTPLATAGVPEPATWATMLAGFGLLGGALRRSGRRRGTAALA